MLWHAHDACLCPVLAGWSQVRRDEDFAPVKNAPGQGLPDSPDTARDAILALHKR